MAAALSNIEGSPNNTVQAQPSVQNPGPTPSANSLFGGFGGFTGGAGGLGSSPNVPAPGTSIDPATGKPHVAGITRAELEERKAAAAGLAGGLASSPNVPVPGTSINPATGQPHTEGITRAELDAMKAKGAPLLDPVPTASEIRRASIIKQNFGVPDNSLSGLDPQVQKEMSGRAQAAAQLAGSTGIMMNLSPNSASPTSPNAKRMSIVEVRR